MKLKTKILLGIIIFVIVLTVAYTVIFCFKGSYPTEIYLALIPSCVAELIILYKLKLKEQGDGQERQNKRTKRADN